MKNKNIWIAFSLGIILTVVIAFLIWPDKEHNNPGPQHDQVMANDDSVKSHKGQFLYIIDSMRKTIVQQDVLIKDLMAGQEQYKGQLDQKAAQVKELAGQIKAMNKDTALNSKVDSLVNLVNNLNYFLVQYEVYTDSLNRVNAALKANYEQVDSVKDKRIAELQSAYDSLFKAYQQLFADSQSLAKDLKRQKLKTKIAGVLAGAAAVLGLIK